MTLNPHDIAEKKFPTVRWNGYDTNAVDDFLDEVAESLKHANSAGGQTGSGEPAQLGNFEWPPAPVQYSEDAPDSARKLLEMALVVGDEHVTSTRQAMEEERENFDRSLEEERGLHAQTLADLEEESNVRVSELTRQADEDIARRNNEVAQLEESARVDVERVRREADEYSDSVRREADEYREATAREAEELKSAAVRNSEEELAAVNARIQELREFEARYRRDLQGLLDLQAQAGVEQPPAQNEGPVTE